MNECITFDQAVDLLGISSEELTKKVRKKSIPFSRVNKEILFHHDELNHWVAGIKKLKALCR